MFIDVQKQIMRLSSDTIRGRVSEFRDKVPPLSLCSIGGFPIIQEEEKIWVWCGIRLDEFEIKNVIREALGLSATLTYMNKGKKTLEELGEICQELDHTWAYHWLNLGFLINAEIEVELAVTRDTRFFCSWPVKPSGGAPFIAHGSIKNWKKFSKHRTDRSFELKTRKIMVLIWDCLQKIL